MGRELKQAFVGIAVAFAVASPAAAAPIDLGPGRDAGVAIDEQGTAYVAWNGTEAGTTSLNVCRLPRAAAACALRSTVPVPGTSITRPFVLVDGVKLTLLSHRYGEGVPGFAATYLSVSTDGGASFAPARRVGTQGFRSAAAGPGAGISLASSADANGALYQRVPTDDGPPADTSAQLSATHVYDGAVGLADAQTPVTVFTTASGEAIVRRFIGGSDLNTSENWSSPVPLGRAAYPHLAGGPRGLFLLSAAADGRLELRRYAGGAFEPPTPLPDGTGETQQAHFGQAGDGSLHAVWPRVGHALGTTLQYAVSTDGAAFARHASAADSAGITDPRVAVAADHQGVASYRTGDGRIRVTPIPGGIDDGPPDTIITAGPESGSTVTTPPTFEFESSEPASRFECSLKPAQLTDQDGPTWAPCTTPFTPPARGFAYLTFLVRAIDAAGNPDPSPARRDYYNDPAPYGDMRIRGIDVFQLVQPNSGARMYSYSTANPGASTAFASFCGGGTPAAGKLVTVGFGVGRLCQATIGSPQRVTYQGVSLDTAKPATALVYVDVAGAKSADPRQPLEVTLTATFPNGRSVGPRLVRTITDPQSTTTSFVTLAHRDRALSQRFAVAFAFPSQWLGTPSINLKATVAFAPGTRSWNEAECYGDTCLDNNSFELRGIPKVSLPPVLITPLFMRSQNTQIVPTTFPNPEAVFDTIRHLVPGGERIQLRNYAGTLDITTQSTLPATPAGTTPQSWNCNSINYGPPGITTQAAAQRQCRSDAISAIINQWATDNPPRYEGGDGRIVQAYDIAAGVINYDSEPGWQWSGNIRNVDRDTVSPVPLLTLACCTRPLTAGTHELLHALTAPHAGQGCPGTGANQGQAGESWPGDDQGRLQGTRFDARQAGTAHVAVDDPVLQLFDVMSYCAATSDTGEANTDAARGNTWISPRNWNRVVAELLDFKRRVGFYRNGRPLSLGKRRARSARQAPPTTAFAVGHVGPQDGRILRVVGPDGSDAVRAPDPSSPVRVRALAADGSVLSDVGVAVERSSEAPAGAPGTFVAAVAPNAAVVELVRGGAVLHRLRRSAAPRISLSRPRAGTRVRERGTLAVAWSASDPDGDELQATVEYSADDGRTWRAVHQGTSSGSATVRGDALPGARRARVRVVVNDGLNEATARSAAFRVDGRRPDIRIVSPQRGTLLQAGIPVRLAAVTGDARGAPLTGRAVRWFAGRRALGSGPELTARLPAGRVTLRAVGRDSGGRTRTASLRVTVAPNRIRLLRLDVPRTVARGARRVRVGVAASSPGTLRAGGRSYRVGTRLRRIHVALPARPRTGPVRVAVRLLPRAGASGSDSGRIEVYRGKPPG